jgi:peptide/nickel transport system permease protein
MAQRDAAPAGVRMLRRLRARLPQYVLVVLLAATVNFALPRLMPGDPIALLLGQDAALLPQEAIQESLARFGLNQSLPEQYLRYLANLLRGDLGFSYQWRQPVAELLLERLPWTALLVGVSLIASSLIGTAAGMAAAWRRGRRMDTASLTTFVFLESIPAFWLGLVLLVVFAAQSDWLPIFGAVSRTDQLTGLDYLLDVGRHLVLPATTLTVASVGGMFLVARSAFLTVVAEDYILVARAKGLTERAIATRHGLPGAALPIVTTMLLRLGFLVGGATVVETVFSYPGLGRLIYQATLRRDFPVVQGTFLLLAVTVVAANFVADVLYPVLDPRVRDGG